MRRTIGQELLIMTVIIIWAAHYSIAKFGVMELSPVVFTLLRFLGVTPLLMAWTLSTEGSLRIRLGDWWQLILVGFFGVALYQTCYLAAAKYTTAANASLIIALSPLFTSLLSVQSGLERFSLRSFFGSLLAFSGVALIIWSSSDTGLGFSLATVGGDLIALAAGFLWGLYPLLTQPLLRRYSPLRIMAQSSLVGTLFLLLFSGKALLAVPWESVSPRAWWCLLYAIVPATAYSLVVWYRVIDQLGPNPVMIHMYLVPALAMLISSRVLQEVIRPSQVWGMVVILSGIALAKSRPHQPPHQQFSSLRRPLPYPRLNPK